MSIAQEIRTTHVVSVNEKLRLSDVEVDGEDYTRRLNLADAEAVRLVQTFAHAFGLEWLAKALAEEAKEGAT